MKTLDCYSFDFMSDIPDVSNNSKYVDYILLNSYINENSKFPPSLWASLSATLKRTANNHQSLHSHFNEQFYQTHPSIFKFFKILYV